MISLGGPFPTLSALSQLALTLPFQVWSCDLIWPERSIYLNPTIGSESDLSWTNDTPSLGLWEGLLGLKN